MKTFRFIVPALVLLFPACEQKLDPPAPEEPQLVMHTLYASLPSDEDPGTRTVLDVTNDRKILWSPKEEISIIANDGQRYQNYQFKGGNEDVSESATFTGKGPADLGTYIALYPWDKDNSIDNDYIYIYTTLPQSQIGKAGSFGDGYLITAAKTSGNSISFSHLCSGLRFMVSEGNIKSVSIQGNNNEKIAGGFKFKFTGDNTPVAESGTQTTVTLTAPDDGCFEPGKLYYIVILPTIFEQGFTLTATTADGKEGTLRFDSPTTFRCGAFKNVKGYLDERIWPVYYGPENSFIVSPNREVQIDLKPYRITDTWGRGDQEAPGVSAPDHAEVLWGENSIEDVNVSGGKLVVHASSTLGSSLVAIKKGDDILWSYLIWVTNGLDKLILPNDKELLPPLGGALYFQWGRKDPLKIDPDNPDKPDKKSPQDAIRLSYSIANPQVFILPSTATNAPEDWFCDTRSAQDASLWGGLDGAKTVWDPCPEGYRVPSEDDLAHSQFDFGYLEENFTKLGYITKDGLYEEQRLYWTRTPSGLYATSLDDTDYSYTDIFSGQARHIAAPVRCISEQ